MTEKKVMAKKKSINAYSPQKAAPTGSFSVKRISAESASAMLQERAILRNVGAQYGDLCAKREKYKTKETQQGTAQLVRKVSATDVVSSAVLTAVSPFLGAAALSAKSSASNKLVVPMTSRVVKMVPGESRKNKLKRLKQQKLELERKKGHCL